MDETTISVARNGAGAKKCRGPAPGEITNKLSIRIISFYCGAGSHEKTAPAPPWQPTCAIQAVHLRHPGTISSMKTPPAVLQNTLMEARDRENTHPLFQVYFQEVDLEHALLAKSLS